LTNFQHSFTSKISRKFAVH